MNEDQPLVRIPALGLSSRDEEKGTALNPRMRRLTADAEQLRTEFAGHPYVAITPLGYEPAEAYRVTCRLAGVALDPASGEPIMASFHQVLIRLPTSYPREKPLATMETPIFHPNFGPRVGDEICIGDYWSPAQTLVDIIVTIGEMIQYQRYNVRSPLNAVAARWVAEHKKIFPIGNVDLFQAEPTVSVNVSRVSGGPATVSPHYGSESVRPAMPDPRQATYGAGPIGSPLRPDRSQEPT